LPDALHCRFARADEIGELGRMIAHSFPGAARPPAWWQEQLAAPMYGGGAETLFIGEEAGRTVAACQVHPLRQWIGGERFACAGIGSVAVSPTHRRRRFGAELVAAALLAARERGDTVSALYPFRTAFYQQLGYGQAGEALQYQVPPGMLPDSDERLRVELLDSGAGRAEALALYDEWAQTQTGQLERGDRTWQHLVEQHDRVLVGYRAADGTLRGYALAVYHAEGTSAERFLEVDELVWTTAESRRGLYAWVASLGDQWRQVLLRALPSERLGDWLREPRLPPGSARPWGLWAPAATLLAGTMFRIVDMETAWRRRTLNATDARDGALQLGIELTDAQVESNSGAWRLALEGDVANIERGAGAAPTLRLDVSTLSRIFIGSLTATAALRAGLAECDRPGLLPAIDHALALPEPCTFDRF
jgi:predicted acetyltransferase